MTLKNNYSKFWIENDSPIVDDFLGISRGSYTRDLVAITGYKRAISNFVNIVTEENIPVRFISKGMSYTDGREVTISATLNEKNFDVAVGVALHEGSHIKFSDFELLKNLRFDIPNSIYQLGEQKDISYNEVFELTKNVLNYIEDRRVDDYVFKSSPGYKGYYHSMYKKFFYSDIIDRGLLSSEKRTENIDSYMFRLINLHNPNSQLNALRGLKEIYQLIDFMDISRLSDTKESYGVAIEVTRVILENIKKESADSSDESSGDDSQETNDSNSSDEGSGDDNQETNDDGSEAKELTDIQKKLFDKTVKKQKDFIENGVKKATLSKSEYNKTKALDESDATYEDVGNKYGWGKVDKVKCLIVKKFSKSLIESDTFSCADRFHVSCYPDKYNFIENGFRLGNTLGRKLKIRGEETSLKYTRKDSGTIDRRLVAELGFNNSNIFSQTFITKYNKTYLHISIDASASMSGDKWNEAMTSAIAMIKACDMAGNVDVVVSIRATHGTSPHSEIPLIMVVYDSRKDKLSKVKSLFSALAPSGFTPEGLCFEAIMKDLIPGNSSIDSYFINYSDGQPFFRGSRYKYYGSPAIQHTKKMVNEMRKKGLKVISYFIQNYDRGYTSINFKKMYGSDAESISPTNMMEVARSMNKRFLKIN